jgi:flagellar secretion chaperone FliS
MTPIASDEYLQSAVLTATPEQLHLMLYDGAIRFARQAAEALRQNDYETSCEKLLRAQKIITEMKSGLRPDVHPQLCEHMTGLYNFVYWRLVDANLRRDVAAIDEALEILDFQRETWRLLVEKTRTADAPVSRRITDPSIQPQVTLCLQG